MNDESQGKSVSRSHEGGGRDDRTGVSRRAFIQRTGAAAVAAGIAPTLGVQAGCTAPGDAGAVEPLLASPQTAIRVVVNGTERRTEVEDRWTLAEFLRDQLDLTGTKIGCNRGECGACTVLVDGEAVYSCSTLAVWVDGRTVQTVEGLARQGQPSPLQEAFMDHNAPQCGFCTPGQLMSATALLEGNPRPTYDEVRSGLVGNLCRCSNYNAIVEAVLAASGSSVDNGGA